MHNTNGDIDFIVVETMWTESAFKWATESLQKGPLSKISYRA